MLEFADDVVGFRQDTTVVVESIREHVGFVAPSSSINYLEFVSKLIVSTSVAPTIDGSVNAILSCATDPVVFGV